MNKKQIQKKLDKLAFDLKYLIDKVDEVNFEIEIYETRLAEMVQDE